MKNDFSKDSDPAKRKRLFSLNKRIFRSEELFENEREIVIVHGEAYYRLQITKAGKLILHK